MGGPDPSGVLFQIPLCLLAFVYFFRLTEPWLYTYIRIPMFLVIVAQELEQVVQ